MSHWAITSDPQKNGMLREARPLLSVLLLAAVLLVHVAAAHGQSTRDEALARVFPGADIRAERVFLTQAQRAAAEELSGVDLPSLLIARYQATRNGTVVGSAYVDTHVVRTKNESLLISLDSERRIIRIEVTAFLEPPEYRAPDGWLEQYESKMLTEDLYLNRSIRPIAGATLTARAAAEAARRVLAIDRVLNP